MELSPASSTGSLLVLAQVDHACGDIISSVMEQLSVAGAHNVHLVPSLTKKGRPGYLLFVDVPSAQLSAVERLLSIELGVLGWRVMSAEHRGLATDSRTVDVVLPRVCGETSVAVPVKVVCDPAGSGRVAHIEHDFCVRLQRELRESDGVVVPLRVLKAHIQSAVADALNEGRSGDFGAGKEKET